MKIAVIGAGIGGVSAACELARDGHDVTVYEKNAGPGGKMNETRLGDFRFDTGPSLFTMPFVAERLFEYCGEQLAGHVDLVPLDPLCRYFYPDGTRFDSFSDATRSQAEIGRINADDAKAYLPFLRHAETLYSRTKAAFLENPLADWQDVKRLKFWDLLRIDAFTTVSERVDQEFRDRRVRQFFKRFATYNGSDPWQAPGTLNVIPHVELNLGGYYVKGGMYRFAEALSGLATSLGVKFHYGVGIERIGVRNGVAEGVVIEGGTQHYDVVVSNADATETNVRLLSDDVLSSEQKRRLEAVEPSSSGFVILLGVDRTYEQLAHHNVFFGDDYRAEFQSIFREGRLAQDPTVYIANTSVSDPDHAPEGGSNLFLLVNAPWTRGEPMTADQAQAYADLVLFKLAERGLRGLQAATVEREVITPHDFLDRWRSHRGSIYGTSSNHRSAAFLRPRNRSPFAKNLYMVGGSTHPGGGIPLVMLSARHACTLIRRDLGLKPSSGE